MYEKAINAVIYLHIFLPQSVYNIFFQSLKMPVETPEIMKNRKGESNDPPFNLSIDEYPMPEINSPGSDDLSVIEL